MKQKYWLNSLRLLVTAVQRYPRKTKNSIVAPNLVSWINANLHQIRHIGQKLRTAREYSAIWMAKFGLGVAKNQELCKWPLSTVIRWAL